MIRDFRKLLALKEAGDGQGLMSEPPEKPGGRVVWSLSPGGARVHTTTAKAARRRGFPVVSADLFDGGQA